MKDHGSRDNRGRTSPSLLQGAPGGGHSERKRTAVTVVRRVGYVASVAYGVLVSNAREARDDTLVEELETFVRPVVDALVNFSLDDTDVSVLPPEGF